MNERFVNYINVYSDEILSLKRKIYLIDKWMCIKIKFYHNIHPINIGLNINIKLIQNFNFGF